MKNQFLDYNTSIQLKELGFREETYAYWSKEYNADGTPELRFAQDSGAFIDWNESDEEDDGYVSAPLYQQAFDWIQKEFGICVNYTPRDINIFKIHGGTNSINSHLGMIPMVRQEFIYNFDLYNDVNNKFKKIDLFVKEVIPAPDGFTYAFISLDMKLMALKKAIQLTNNL
jgi:hypothetical protein